jgi:hypothetical protein
VDSTPYPDEDADDGLLTWNDLTAPAPYGFGRNLPPGESFLVTTIFRITHDIEVTTTNTATATGVVDLYDNPANDDSDDEDLGGEGEQGIPTPVEVRYFRAVAVGSAVRLEWATAAELGTLGFYVYRAPNANFDAAQTVAYVLATGPDSTYDHVDRGVTPGQSYWYWLVEETNFGEPDTYGPVQGGVEIDSLPHHVYLPLVLGGVQGAAQENATVLIQTIQREPASTPVEMRPPSPLLPPGTADRRNRRQRQSVE